MSRDNRNTKRQRIDNSPPNLNLIHMHSGVYRIGQFFDPAIAVGNGDLYRDLKSRGTIIVDNTADLGRFENGLLLQRDSRVYLGFASRSQYSTFQVASALSYFHDVRPLSDFVERFDMSRLAPSDSTRATCACIRLDFSKFADYNTCVPETLAAVETSIRGIVLSAIRAFREKYEGLFPRKPPSGLPPCDLPTFFDWLAMNDTKLFVSVHELHKVLERPIDASIWEGFTHPAMNDRLELVYELVLTPIWTQLCFPAGVLRKFLMVGPYLVESLVHPPFLTNFPGLPTFKDLSSYAALHGFSSSQIRRAYSLSEIRVSTKVLREYLSYCDVAGHVSTASTTIEVPYIYTTESLQAIIPNVRKPNFEHELLHAYVEKEIRNTLEPARRALFPLLLRNASFRGRIFAMLQGHWPSDSMGPVFSIDDIVNNTPGLEKRLTRVFMHCGLAKVVQDTNISFRLPGPCVTKLLKRLLAETAIEKYIKPYQWRKQTQGGDKSPDDAAQQPRPEQPSNAPQPGNAPVSPQPEPGNVAPAQPEQPGNASTPVADQDIPALNLDSVAQLKLKFTEASIANLILDYYSEMTDPKQLPKDEAAFQETFARLLRAALLAEFDRAFVNNVLIEVWVRRPPPKAGESYNLRCDIVCRVRFAGEDWLYIFELKYFNLGRTEEATHEKLWKVHEGVNVLDSQKYRSPKSTKLFWGELASIQPLPPHWYADRRRMLSSMTFPLTIYHIRAKYNASYKGMAGSGLSKEKTKKATDVAEKTIKQVVQYRDAAVLGVGDELVKADQLLRQLGWADTRITDMGPGLTKIIPFAIVNVAGALVYVHKLQEKTLDRRIGIVDDYPWTPAPTREETTKTLDKKESYARSRR